MIKGLEDQKLHIPPAKLICTYQIRGTKLHFTLPKLLGFTLGNGALNRFYLSKECMFTAQGP